jgi:uncharacterized protein
MKLEGDYRFDAPLQEVWNALFDPVVLAAVMPGCEKLDLVDGKFVGEIKVKVGPVQGKFNGVVELADRDEPRSYKMIVDGRGAPGFVKATVTVALEAEDTATRIRYDADAQVGGKLASVGQRLVEASARAIVAQSLEGLHENIKLRAAASAAATPAPAPAAATPPTPTPTPTSTPTSTPAAAPAAPAAPPPVVFTPVKVKESDVAKRVAKEVASTLFPRSLLVAIIAIQAAVIVWLLVR